MTMNISTSTSSASNSHKNAILFLGATGGCGFSVLRRSLAAGHICIALCRTPAKLTETLGDAATGPSAAGNLLVAQGNAHDIRAVSQALQHPTNPTALVDMVVFTLGGAFNLSKMTIDDTNVCRTAMSTLLSALTAERTSPSGPRKGQPRILTISTTGISEQGRDVPIAFLPMYHIMLKDPHKDKKAMEDLLLASDETWTLVRPSFLVDGPPENMKKIRVGMEDPVGKVLISKGVGYVISREEVGRWIFENLVEKSTDTTWMRKIATITW